MKKILERLFNVPITIYYPNDELSTVYIFKYNQWRVIIEDFGDEIILDFVKNKHWLVGKCGSLSYIEKELIKFKQDNEI